MSDGTLKTDPLFVGLTRPSLFLGVSSMYVMVNGFGCLIFFIQTSDFKVIPVAVFVHMIGYLICFREPLFMELFYVRSQKCMKCKNKIYHRANSYDVY